MNPCWKVGIAACLREGWHEVREFGEGYFICLDYEPTSEEQDEILGIAEVFFSEAWWSECPEEHGDFKAVLCCVTLREDEEE